MVCDGSGCPACGRTGWMTILGAGMVHPVVLRNGGIDPERYQGFAFGMGTDRITMLRYGIRDIRAFMAERPALPGAVLMRVPLVLAARDTSTSTCEPEALAERLTLLGMEVKGIERIGADWQNVVVGELLEVGPHPNSTKLSADQGPRGCLASDAVHRLRRAQHRGRTARAGGAAGCRAAGRSAHRGQRASPARRARGCSAPATSCASTTDADGILILPADTPIGLPVADVVGDVVLDVDVKPNRGDALSMVGLAREVAAAVGGTLRWPTIEVPESGDATTDHVSVDVQDAVALPAHRAALRGRRDRRPEPRHGSSGGCWPRACAPSPTSSTPATT